MYDTTESNTMAPLAISELELEVNEDCFESDCDSVSLRDKASLSSSIDDSDADDEEDASTTSTVSASTATTTNTSSTSTSDASVERRRVSFAVDDECHEAEPMSDEDCRALFMQTEDFERCNEDVRRTVRKYMKHVTADEPFDFTYCTIRGVEELIDHMERRKNIAKECRSRAEIKADHLQAVLKEHRRQKARQLDDDEHLRRISQCWSYESIRDSLVVAENDEDAMRKLNPRWSAENPRGRRNSATFERPVLPDDLVSKTCMPKPPKMVNKSIDIAIRRGSKFGSFLRRRK